MTNASLFEFIYKFLNDTNMFNVNIWNYNYSFYHLKYVTQLSQPQWHERKTDDSEQYAFKLQYGKILKRVISNSTNVRDILIEDIVHYCCTLYQNGK